MAAGLLAGIGKAIVPKVTTSSAIAGGTKGALVTGGYSSARQAIMGTTVSGKVTRGLGITNLIGGGSGGGRGGGISPSNFSSSSMRSRISNIGGSVDTSGGLGDMLTSESIMGRRTGQDTTQDFLNTFGSEKTGKVIRSSLMVLRDTFVETFETARILRTALSQMDGLGGAGGKGGGKKGKGGGLLGMLGSMLMSPLGIIGGGLLAKKFGGLKGLKGLFGKGGKVGKKVPITRSKVPITGSKSKNLFNDTFSNFDKAGLDAGTQMNVDGFLDPSSSSKIGSKSGKETFENLMGKPPVDDVAEGTAKVTQNLTKSTNVVKEGIKKGSKGGGILGKGKNIAKNLFKNPKKALGAGILGIGGLALGGIGMHVVGRTGEDTWDRFDGVIDKFDSVLDEQSKDKTVRSTSQNAVVQGGQVVSGNMSQNEYEKSRLESKLENVIEIHGFNSPEANEIQKRMMVLSGTPAEAIYTDPEGKLQLKSFSSFDGKTSVGGVKKKKKKGGGLFGGIKRAVGGAADFATLGMFDFDKRNTRGAPKGFGLKRIMGGVADAITAGATDYDKRGTGFGQMKLGENIRRKKLREAYENNPRVIAHRKKMAALKESIINPFGNTTIGGLKQGDPGFEEALKNARSMVSLNTKSISVPKSVKKTPKVINVPSPSSGADNNSAAGGGTMSPPSSSGAGSNIAFPPSHNGVSYAAVETQSQMNLVMAD